jgi:hypothetical protein
MRISGSWGVFAVMSAPNQGGPGRRGGHAAPEAEQRTSFEGDVAWRELRARPSRDSVPEPPPASTRRFEFAPTARLAATTVFAAFAVFLLVRSVTKEGGDAFWSRTSGTQVMREVLTGSRPVQGNHPRAESVAEAPVPTVEPAAAPAPASEPPIASARSVVVDAPAPPVQAAMPAPQVQAAVAAPQVQAAIPAPQVQAAIPVPQVQATVSPPSSVPDREEIVALYRRGEELIQQGNVVAARLVLARAAEAGDARSALALGATYDPDALRNHRVVGLVANIDLARQWYAKAAKLGSTEAAQRIELLARGR